MQAFFPEKNWVSVHENNLNHSLFRIRHNNKKNLKSYFQLSLLFGTILMCLLIENVFLDQGVYFNQAKNFVEREAKVSVN